MVLGPDLLKHLEVKSRRATGVAWEESKVKEKSIQNGEICKQQEKASLRGTG